MIQVVVNMIIHNIHFPFYGIIILLSVLIGMIYIYLNLKKNGNKSKEILYFYILYLTFALIGGKMYTLLVYYKTDVNLLTVGLSAYGGLIGVVIGSIIFEKIFYCNKNIIKYTILSLPLVYGLTKIACFIAGCCNGIPYSGIFYVIYRDGLDIKQFPIQIVETIVFLFIFFICNKYKDKKNINFITLLVVFIFKFLLDFLRYDHINLLLSRNQIVSILLIVILLVIKKTNIIDKILVNK